MTPDTRQPWHSDAADVAAWLIALLIALFVFDHVERIKRLEALRECQAKHTIAECRQDLNNEVGP